MRDPTVNKNTRLGLGRANYTRIVRFVFFICARLALDSRVCIVCGLTFTLTDICVVCGTLTDIYLSVRVDGESGVADRLD